MTPPSFVDTHTHIQSAPFDEDRDAVFERALAAGVRQFIAIGAGDGLQSAHAAVALAGTRPYVWAAVGVHPHDAGETHNLETLKALAQDSRVVAIGETGLDFHYDFAPREAQEVWFRRQVQLAREVKKPIIIHCRLAAPECLQVLREEKAEEVGGVFHCFSEDANFAATLRELNFLISIPGIVTFKKSQALRDTLRSVPIEQIMLETDAPYLAPEPYRGKRNESSYLIETARAVAATKGISIEALAKATTENACRLFGLPVAEQALPH